MISWMYFSLSLSLLLRFVHFIPSYLSKHRSGKYFCLWCNCRFTFRFLFIFDCVTICRVETSFFLFFHMIVRVAARLHFFKVWSAHTKIAPERKLLKYGHYRCVNAIHGRHYKAEQKKEDQMTTRFSTSHRQLTNRQNDKKNDVKTMNFSTMLKFSPISSWKKCIVPCNFFSFLPFFERWKRFSLFFLFACL